MWSYTNSKKITHEHGHSIELNAGTWYSPKDLHPTIEPGTKALDAARLIREGLEFAECFPYAQQPSTVKPASLKSNPLKTSTQKAPRVSNRPILSFKSH